KPNWRFHMTLNAGGFTNRSQTVPMPILEQLCGKPDGCEVRIGRRLWSATELAARTRIFHFSYNSGSRTFASTDKAYGKLANGAGVQHAGDVDGFCYFTNETFQNNGSKGNIGEGMQLLLYGGGSYAGRTCELTLIP